tara:strand:- start:7455 stop:11612 length:4158 start_codon:yes stop_codon:yes gene_type:complete
MAAMYDQLGNYIGDDGVGAPPIDDMRAALALKRNKRSPLPAAVANIPKISPELQALMAIDAKPLSLDDIYARLTTPKAQPLSRTEQFTRDMNELPKQFADVENVLFGGPTRAAVLQPWEALLKHAYKMPGIAYRERIAKDPQSLREAAQMRKDLEASTGEGGMFPTQPLQTQGGQDFASGVAKTLDTFKVPAAWPIVPTPTRPMLTGSDIRAMKGNVQNVARQVGDIPIDYRNAQSGFTRMDPVTGKPTVGAKAQSLMDDWANVLQRRQEVTGTPTFGGIAPETNMYAVRPDKGTRIIQPTRTEDTSTHPFYVDPLTNIVSEVASVAELDNKRLLNRYTDLDSHRLPSQRGAALPVTVKRQINNYITGRLQEIYPDVPIRSGEGGDDALHAAFQIGNKPTIRDQKLLGMYEDFFKTDEGKAAIAQSGGTLVPPSVHAERHAAASNWLNSTFKNYLDTRIGTTADPLLQKAKQGVTYKPASELEGYAESVYDTARLNRTDGGFPQTSVFMPEFRALGDKMDVVSAELNELEARKAELTAALPPESEMQGRSFNDVIPGYNDFMRKYDAKIAERNKLRKDMANLRIAQDYETLADAAVQPRIVSKVLNELPPQEVPFYPSLTLAPPESIVYNLKKGTLGALGIEDMVSSFYNDVLTGKVPVEKLKGLTVDKYVQQHFDKRRLREIEEEKAAQTYLTNVNTALRERIQQVPNDNIFYNAAVIEFDANTPKEQAYKDLSADTTILDICVAECGGADPKKKHFITGKSQTHEAMYDITTGERNPNSNLSRDYSTYTDEIYNGTKLASIRDSTTGYPAATIRMSPASMPGQYNINWVKGYKNDTPIDRAYSEGIAAYLNSRENVIASSGSELQTNAGVFDTQTPAGMRALSQRVPGMDPEEVRYLDFDFVELPRFVTQNQFNEIVAGAVDGTPSATAQQSRFAVESTADMRRRLTEQQLDEANDLHTHISDQLEEIVYDAIEQNNSPLSAQRDFLQAIRDDPSYYVGEIDPAIVEYALRFIEEQNPDIAPQDTQTALNNLDYTPSRALAQQQQDVTPPRSIDELYQMFLDIGEAALAQNDNFLGNDRFSFNSGTYFTNDLANGIRNSDPQLVGLDNLTQQERELLAHVVEEEGYNPNYFPGDYRRYDALTQPAPEQLAPPPAEVQLPPEDLGLFEPDPTHPANRPVASTQAPTAELYTQELTRLNARHDALTDDIAEWNRQMLPYIRRENDGTITPEQLRDLENLRDQYDDTVREMRDTQQQIGETARQQQAAFEMQQTPQRNAVTPNISNLSDTELSQRLSIEQSTQAQNVFAQIVRSARDSNIALTPELIDSVSNWSFNAQALAPEQKEFLKRLLTRHIQRERGVGFAKGGKVRIAKTIPAMRAELRRT